MPGFCLLLASTAFLANSNAVSQLLLGGLGYVEVDHLGYGLRALDGHQHVGWLQVAMDDPRHSRVVGSHSESWGHY